MFKSCALVSSQFRIALIKQKLQQQQRMISALYISGDKANEIYVTLQPYLDFECLIKNKELLQQSIAQRGLKIDAQSILEKYAAYRKIKFEINDSEEKREALAKKIKELTKSGGSAEECNALKEQGKALRSNLKVLKENCYPIEDDFIEAFLNLPNALHPDCPIDNQEKLIYRSRAPRIEQGEPHLQRTDLIHFIDIDRYYMMKEAAEFDIHATHALTSYFADTGGFLQMANPDFVRCVLLEANATPLTQYHVVKEEQLQNALNAAYLCGGAAFESYLGSVTKLIVYPSVLPLRFICSGRSYEKMDTNKQESNLFTATQTNAVQTFVATESANEAEQQVEKILTLAVDFYKALGIHFRIVYADASVLTLSECLRAVIEVYSPAEKRYICVGRVSNYSDFVSKRILFAMRQQKDYHFLHLVGGPVMYTSRLIAALIENGIPLEHCKLLGTNDASNAQKTQTAIDEFKGLFK